MICAMCKPMLLAHDKEMRDADKLKCLADARQATQEIELHAISMELLLGKFSNAQFR